jgi:hypothetical protein
VARPLRNNSASSSSGNSSNSSNSNKGAAHLPQPIRARVAGSRKVDRQDSRKKRRRRGRNNFGAISVAASLCRGVLGFTMPKIY